MSVVRSKTTPKKETLDFRLPSVAHDRLCLGYLLMSLEGARWNLNSERAGRTAIRFGAEVDAESDSVTQFEHCSYF